MVGWPALQVVERLDVPMHGDALPAGITSWERLVVRSADLEVVGVDARGGTPVLECRSDGTAELRFSRDGVDVAYAEHRCRRVVAVRLVPDNVVAWAGEPVTARLEAVDAQGRAIDELRGALGAFSKAADVRLDVVDGAVTLTAFVPGATAVEAYLSVNGAIRPPPNTIVVDVTDPAREVPAWLAARKALASGDVVGACAKLRAARKAGVAHGEGLLLLELARCERRAGHKRAAVDVLAAAAGHPAGHVRLQAYAALAESGVNLHGGKRGHSWVGPCGAEVRAVGDDSDPVGLWRCPRGCTPSEEAPKEALWIRDEGQSACCDDTGGRVWAVFLRRTIVHVDACAGLAGVVEVDQGVATSTELVIPSLP